MELYAQKSKRCTLGPMTTTKSLGSATPTVTQALTDPMLPVGEMIPVQYSSIPADIRRDVTRTIGNRGWTEAYGLLSSQGGCRFGCKVYARKRGAIIEYGVFHSLTYGHSHSPNAR